MTVQGRMAVRSRLFVLVVSAAAAFLAVGCGHRSSETSSVIGICQWSDQPALDQCRRGFMEEMNRLGYTKERGFDYDFQSAHGEAATAKGIAEKFVRAKYKLIFSIATPMSQAVQGVSGSASIPVIFGAITDPVSAKLVKSMSAPGGNMTGSSDQWPYFDQVRLFTRLMPGRKRLGVVVNPAEANTQYALSQVRAAANKLGVSLVEAPVTDLTEVRDATLSLLNRVDAIYVTADNTAMSGAAGIVEAASSRKKPVIAGDVDTYRTGCVAGLGVSFYSLGVENARMARRILSEHVDPGSIPVFVSQESKLYINLAVAEKLGVKVPEELIQEAAEVIPKK